MQPFPGPGRSVQVSTAGGAQVRWRRDGKELFYIALDGRLMAVPIALSADGKSPVPGKPSALFATRVGGAVQVLTHQYMVSPDGQRFLMNTALEENVIALITLLLNWRPRP